VKGLDLEFQKSPLTCLHRVIHEVQNQEQTLEVRLSEGMPDVGRILWSWGQVILREKQWRSGGIDISGGIQSWILYAPEDATDPRCVENWIPFRMSWDLGSEQREGTIRVAPVLRFLDARPISARKLMLRAGIGMLAEAFVEEKLEYSMPKEVPQDVEMLRQVFPVQLDRTAGEKDFQLEELVALPASLQKPEKLLCWGLRPDITELRVSGNRLVFRGNANAHLLYRCENGQLQNWDFPLPFSQLVQLDTGYEDSAGSDITMAVTALEMSLEESGQIRIQCGMLGQYCVRERILLELVTDAYSPLRKCIPVMGEMELPVLLDSRQESFAPEQNIPQEADIVVDVAFFPDYPRQRRDQRGVELQMQGQFQVLFYASDGSLRTAHSRWEGTMTVPASADVWVRTEPLLRSINAPAAVAVHWAVGER
jgi:hypothetical protein